MKNIWMLAVVALLSACSASMIPQNEVPERAKTNLNQLYAGATDVQWSKSRKDMTTTYTAKFKKGGKSMTVKFNEKGEVTVPAK